MQPIARSRVVVVIDAGSCAKDGLGSQPVSQTQPRCDIVPVRVDAPVAGCGETKPGMSGWISRSTCTSRVQLRPKRPGDDLVPRQPPAAVKCRRGQHKAHFAAFLGGAAPLGKRQALRVIAGNEHFQFTYPSARWPTWSLIQSRSSAVLGLPGEHGDVTTRWARCEHSPDPDPEMTPSSRTRYHLIKGAVVVRAHRLDRHGIVRPHGVVDLQRSQLVRRCLAGRYLKHRTTLRGAQQTSATQFRSAGTRAGSHEAMAGGGLTRHSRAG